MADAAMAMGMPLEDIAHVIQVALTPVFLLSGIGALLNVVNARLARLADRADLLHDRMVTLRGPEAAALHARLLQLRRRLRALDVARAGGAVGGSCICIATFTLFLGGLQNTAVATVLFLSFGASVLCTLVCLCAYLAEILLSWRRHVARPELDK